MVFGPAWRIRRVALRCLRIGVLRSRVEGFCGIQISTNQFGGGGLPGSDGSFTAGYGAPLRSRDRREAKISGRRIPLLRLLRESSHDDVVESLGCPRYEIRDDWRRRSKVRVHSCCLAVTSVRDSSGKRLKQNAAQRVDVDSRVQAPSFPLLRGHIVGGAHHDTG